MHIRQAVRNPVLPTTRGAWDPRHISKLRRSSPAIGSPIQEYLSTILGRTVALSIVSCTRIVRNGKFPATAVSGYHNLSATQSPAMLMLTNGNGAP